MEPTLLTVKLLLTEPEKASGAFFEKNVLPQRAISVELDSHQDRFTTAVFSDIYTSFP
jgi:hypothetical protein